MTPVSTQSMTRLRHQSLARLAILFLLAGTVSSYADDDDDEERNWDFASQVELGAVYTSGNTHDQNVRVRSRVDAERDAWQHRFNFDGFRSSKRNELAAERFLTAFSSTFNFDDNDFIRGRASHERDRFSGFDYQSDVSISYGQLLLRHRSDMSWDYTIGAGMRNSKSPSDDFNEAIVRLSTEYRWDISSNARFTQELSVDAGDRVTVSRSTTGVESDVLDNISMKFTVQVRHRTLVAANRKPHDAEASITLLVRL